MIKINNKIKKILKRYYDKKYDYYKENKINKKRIRNSIGFTNIKSVDNGYLILKSNEVAKLIEVKAIDLSLTSKEEKDIFFNSLKSLYQINGLNLKCYKLDEKINLNSNKENLDKLINKYKGTKKELLLNENRKLIIGF